MRISDWSSDVCSSDGVERQRLAQMALDVGGLPRLEGARAGIGPRGGALAVDGVGKRPVEPGQRLGRTAVAAQPCAVVVQRRALLRGPSPAAGAITPRAPLVAAPVLAHAPTGR